MGTIKRIRDPIHGLITFDFDDEVDKTAWRLMNTPEFQRLRRVKQLGVSEFIFPGATHTRLSHSIGVFHLARRLMKVAERYVPADKRNPSRMRTALLAALLHDLGHGPFSHAFESAEKARIERDGLPKDSYRDHEDWTAELIQNRKGNIRPILKGEFGVDGAVADDIANMLKGSEQDLYSSVVSSSFDADRLDYLQRDRMMTGSGAGAIDLDWLLDNLRVDNVPANSGEDAEDNGVETVQAFVFEEKALQSAESFILARFHLYSQVYLHKTTRGIEKMLTAFLLAFSEEAAKGAEADTTLMVVPEDHPLRAYYAKATPDLEAYFALDDAVVWSAIEISATKGKGLIRYFAERICSRGIMKGIAIDMVNPQPNDIARRKFIDQHLKGELGKTVFEDRAPLSIYKDPSKETVKPHKRVHIRREGGRVVDITSLSKPVAALYQEQEILRYYFINQDDLKKVQNTTGGSHAGN
jgi:HD superfamily phosphohydrolase